MDFLKVNPFHPHYPKIDLMSAGFWQGKAKTKRNFLHLITALNFEKSVHGLDFICESNDSKMIRLGSDIGFRWLMDCHEISVCPFRAVANERNNAVQLLQDFDHHSLREKEFKQLLVKRYIETHDWNPVADNCQEQLYACIGEDLSPEFSTLLIDGQVIVGASWASRVDEELEIIWTFGSGRHDDDEYQVIKQLIAKQLACARNANLSRVSFEIDSTHRGLFMLLRELPLQQETTWKRYRLPFVQNSQ